MRRRMITAMAATAAMASILAAGPAAAGHDACDGPDSRLRVPTDRVGLRGDLIVAVWADGCAGASIDHDTITCEERILHESIGGVTVAACPGEDAEGREPIVGAWVPGGAGGEELWCPPGYLGVGGVCCTLAPGSLPSLRCRPIPIS